MNIYWLTSPSARFIALAEYYKSAESFRWRVWRVADIRGGLTVVDKGVFPVESLFGRPFAYGGGHGIYSDMMSAVAAAFERLGD